MSFEDEFQAEATDLIEEFGGPAVLHTPKTQSGPAHAPVYTPGADLPCTAVDLNTTLGVRSGALVTEFMRTLYISPVDLGPCADFNLQYEITIKGNRHVISKLRPYQPANIVIYYVAELANG